LELKILIFKINNLIFQQAPYQIIGKESSLGFVFGEIFENAGISSLG
jgi:hypothetical protein